ncbi:hypothetical protein ElyMa_002633600 [Elysia marginata]|uniref:Uncharacterized protein n=1 Tax=Elysia marginata TaxID=1093978 RepID=A0AAV4H6K5_9GAST|nr:hypothetical protein ElyMa_002633600 [Elysia marginata]
MERKDRGKRTCDIAESIDGSNSPSEILNTEEVLGSGAWCLVPGAFQLMPHLWTGLDVADQTVLCAHALEGDGQ